MTDVRRDPLDISLCTRDDPVQERYLVGVVTADIPRFLHVPVQDSLAIHGKSRIMSPLLLCLQLALKYGQPGKKFFDVELPPSCFTAGKIVLFSLLDSHIVALERFFLADSVLLDWICGATLALPCSN